VNTHLGKWHRPLACANRRDACSTLSRARFFITGLPKGHEVLGANAARILGLR